MELGANDRDGGGSLILAVNKVHGVYTIARVAEMLGEDEDWLWDVATEMDPEDGLIWVYGPGDESIMAFTVHRLRHRVQRKRCAHGTG